MLLVIQDWQELIVTQWDVNELENSTEHQRLIRINSYIVGCKYRYICNSSTERKELIVTQWDVNALIIAVNCCVWSELIVTQWDVNIVASRYDHVNVFELIVTQWDVNVQGESISPIGKLELIVTQWDVNLTRLAILLKQIMN